MFSNNLSSILLACTLGLVSNSVYANTSLTIGYSGLSTKVEAFDTSLSVVTLGFAYEVDTMSESFTLMPELLIGKGVKNDTAEIFGFDVIAADVSIERYLVLSLRGNYTVSDNVYLFAQPAYANLKVGVSNFGESSSDSEWSFGYGVGAGFSPTDNVSLELAFAKFDETDAITGAFRYRF
jgi:opacity protein-like surface antigen